MNFLKQISSDHGADGGWFALRQYKKAMDAKETPLSNRHIHQSLSTTEKNKYNFLDSPDKQHSYETSTEFAPRDEELSPKEKQIPESNKYKRKPLKIKTNITDNNLHIILFFTIFYYFLHIFVFFYIFSVISF